MGRWLSLPGRIGGIVARLFAATILKAHPVRAWSEALVIGLVLLIILAIPIIPDANTYQNSVFIALLTAVSIAALRLRRFAGRWYVAPVRFVLVGCLPTFLLSVVLLWVGTHLYEAIMMRPAFTVEPLPGLTAIVTQVLGIYEQMAAADDPAVITATLAFGMLVSCQIAFTTVYLGIRLWVFWQRLQRQHLIWSITNSHLLLVFIGAFFWAVILVIGAVSTYEYTLFHVINNIVPMAIAIGVMMAIILVIVLPPSIVLSYFAARRTTRRLQHLMDAANALGSGDYAVRAWVEGEDEVATLQANFNTMAEALRQAMTDLQAERDAVSTLLDARRTLMASVSHELRTPVAVLRSYLESMLANRQGELPEAIAHDIAIMAREAGSMQRLIDDLFTLSRAEIGKLDLQRQMIDAGNVIRQTVSAVAAFYWQTQRVAVSADLPPQLPIVSADPDRLKQILHNLLRNAVQHTPPGGIVMVSACAEDGALVIQVKDTGEGIAPEDLPHIWEHFYRSEQARQQDSRGTGLGLALVKDLVQAMDGFVTVKSTLGQGSCFTICLPGVQQPSPATCDKVETIPG